MRDKLFYLAKILYASYFRLLLSAIHRSITISDGALFKGMPIIEIVNGARVEIGKNAVINSSNHGYHINMHSPVKLFADRKGAVIRIGENTRIHGTCIHAYELVEIGKNCIIAANCQIIDGNAHDVTFSDIENRVNTKGGSDPVIIGDNVWIGANCFILPGVRIGDGSIIAACSVVTKDVPSMVVAAGNPAHTVRAN